MWAPSKPPPKPLQPAMPDLGAAQLEHAVLALEHVDAALLQHGDQLVAAVDVPVVVAEHGEHRHVDVAHGGRHHGALLGLAVRGQVAGQQHEVDAVAQPGERLRPALLVALAAEVDVAGGGDPDRALVAGARCRRCSPSGWP